MEFCRRMCSDKVEYFSIGQNGEERSTLARWRWETVLFDAILQKKTAPFHEEKALINHGNAPADTFVTATV